MFASPGTKDPEFRHEIIAINLRRIPWLLAAAMLLTVWAIAGLWDDPSTGWLRAALAIDLASAGLFLALNGWVKGLAPDSPWRPLYVWTTVVLALAYMDGYYFLAGQSFGQNPAYILGVVMAATFFLLPPQRFLPLLAGNHLLYCALLPVQAGPETPLLPILIQNTTGATVAGLVSVLLFQARREEYFQRRALATSNHTLEKRNAQLNDLMAITAHDLRSPLLGLRDLLSLMRQASLPERPAEILDHATRGCAGMVSLVNRLLDAHAAEEQAEKSLKLDQTDVREIVAAAVGRARIHHSARDVSVHLELPEKPVVLSVNPPALGQVLDNLLSNAVKFSPSGSSVAVTLSGGNGRWHCDVRDSGPGIPEEERASLFQKFHRGANPPASGEEGSGLGLFIAATFMQAMGGGVEYLPGQAKGSLFRIDFGPAARS